MKSKTNIWEIIKSVILVVLSTILLFVLFPFYVLYAFTKSVCNIEQVMMFYEHVWDIVFKTGDIKFIEKEYRRVEDENVRLRECLRQIRAAAEKDISKRIAGRYNALYEVIWKCCKEFKIL